MTLDLDVEEIQQLLPLATDAERDQLERLLELHLSLESPLAYAMRVSPRTQPFAHVVLLDQYLVALIDHALYDKDSMASALAPDLPEGIGAPAVFEESEDGDGSGRFVHPETGEECIYNLAISMPPQHGKSYMVSEHLPAWYLTKYPNRNMAIVSYEETFATSWAYKVRQKIEEHPEYGIDLDPNTKAKGEWSLKGFRGGMMAAGVGGPLTGRSIHLLVMDDLIKNAEEALSDTRIKGTHEWWLTTAKTRNQSPRRLGDDEPEAGVRVLMHTRWSENDLIGFVQRTEPGQWYYLNLPALSEGPDPEVAGHRPDPLGRKKGAPLAPMLHSKAVLEQIRDTGDPEDPGSGGAFWFEAMYQGYPTIEGQGIFARPYNHYERRSDKFIFPDGYVTYYDSLRRFVSVDLAISTKTSADFTVFMELGQASDGRLLVLDILRMRLESPDHMSKLKEWIAERGRPMFVAIEDKTFGSALLQQARREGGLVGRAMKADTDKITRAIPAGQAVRNGQVWWPAPNGARWVPTFEGELGSFPTGGVHDDMVDALAYGVQAWLSLGGEKSREVDNDMSQEAKVRRNLAKLLKKKKAGRGRHPMLGRL